MWIEVWYVMMVSILVVSMYYLYRFGQNFLLGYREQKRREYKKRIMQLEGELGFREVTLGWRIIDNGQPAIVSGYNYFNAQEGRYEELITSKPVPAVQPAQPVKPTMLAESGTEYVVVRNDQGDEWQVLVPIRSWSRTRTRTIQGGRPVVDDELLMTDKR